MVLYFFILNIILNTESNIQGFVERITFQSEESGFCVARMKEKGKRELTVIVGKMPSIQEGEVMVNDVVETRKRNKIKKGFIIQFQDNVITVK